MVIEPVPHSAFVSLTSCGHALKDAENPGCGWYATTDRRVAGRIFLDHREEKFRISVLHFVKAGWEIREPHLSFSSFDEAQTALVESMSRLSVGKPITLKDVTPRVRFGKGRSANASNSPSERG